MNSPVNAHAEYAADLAWGAGDILLHLQTTAHSSELGTSDFKSRGDEAAQDYLAERLGQERPDDAVLSEEAPDSTARFSADRVWIIDPLDGTREFSEGRADWAVHVALWEAGELSAGAVALPGRGLVLTSADRPRQTTVDSAPGRIRLAVSRTRPTAVVDHVVTVLGDVGVEVELVPLGSAGYKTSMVIMGEVDAYLHAGGQWEWDSAAPVVVARNAGLHTSRIDGSPLRYNRPNSFLPDLLVCVPSIAPLLLTALESYEEGSAVEGRAVV